MRAACAVAESQGLAFAAPVALSAATNVLVHMSPAPVVARVMTATSVLHPDIKWWLECELAVGEFLAERGGPAVPPTDMIDPGPYEHDGFWMSFWRFIEHDPTPTLDSPELLGRSLRELHEALAGYQGDLPTLASVADSLERLLNELEPSAQLTLEELEAMKSELARLRPLVFESSLPAQALHGDVSMSNLLRGDRGLLWNDLEDVCRGPTDWDVASLVVSVRDRGASPQFVDEVLGAYGAPEVERLADFFDADALYGKIWKAFQAR